MKKFFYAATLAVFLINQAKAQPQISYYEEMYSLGTVSGQGLACQVKQYDNFELLARAIIVGKAQNGQQQKNGMQEYNRGKVDAFMAIEDERFASCNDIIKEFANQKIFQSTLYSDGRIKLYDGTMITPRKKYDANKLYQKDPDAFAKADAMYKKVVALAEKNSKNAKKIPLVDSNYEKYGNQF